MPATDADVIPEDECWELLRSERIGRFAVDTGRGPRIFPVNHTVHERLLYFRTGRGQKVAEGWAHPRAAFEVDGRDGQRFWSVVLEGTITILGDDDPALGTILDGLVSLHPSPKHLVIRFAPELVSGRRFVPPHPAGLWVS